MRHSRCSLSLKSLKFLQGLPQDSSRRGRFRSHWPCQARSSARHGCARGWGPAGRCDCIPYIFLTGRDYRTKGNPGPKRAQVADFQRLNDALMFAAGPGRDSDLVRTVTNMQQIFPRSRPGKTPNQLSDRSRSDEWQKENHGDICQRVEQPLAHFPHLRSSPI